MVWYDIVWWNDVVRRKRDYANTGLVLKSKLKYTMFGRQNKYINKQWISAH